MSTRGGRRPRATLAALAAVPLLAAALAGCSVRGTVVVLGDNLDVDLQVTHPSDTELTGPAPCGTAAHFTAVTLLSDTRRGAVWSCRYRGPARSFGDGILTHSDGHHALFVGSLIAYAQHPDDPLTDLDVTVVFPGRVVSAVGGSVAGTSVRFTDAGARLAAVAEDGTAAQATPPAWLTGSAWALGGAAAGFALALAAMRARDRRR